MDQDQVLDKLLDKVDRLLAAQAKADEQRATMHSDITEIKIKVRETNGKVGDLYGRVCVLEDWRVGVVYSIAETGGKVTDMRVQLAELAVKYGTLGGVFAAIVAILKAIGVF